MDLSKYTIKSQEAIQRSQELAVANGQQSIEVAHLLKGILDVDDQVSPFLLKKLDVPMGVLHSVLDRMLETLP